MGNYAPLGILFIAGFAALHPQPVAWIYVLTFVVFEYWLLRRMNREGSAPPAVNQAPYFFTEEEAALIARFRLYFAAPQLARAASSTLAALGLTALVLSPWFAFRTEVVPAILTGFNLFAVGALTRRLAPVMVLRIAASKGDRAALRMLELHDPLWEKIRAANARVVADAGGA
jgi:hypothetical protein